MICGNFGGPLNLYVFIYSTTFRGSPNDVVPKPKFLRKGG